MCRFVYIVNLENEWCQENRNTPEMARALDSFCFANLERLMALHVAVTNDLPREDPGKFSLSSRAVESAMERCWSIIPDKRMADDDISGLEHVLQKGIEHQGSIIPDEDVRKGHIAMRLNGSALMKSQVRRVQPLTELILHPDAIEIYIKLSPSAKSDINKDIDEAEQFQQFSNIFASENDDSQEEKNEGFVYLSASLAVIISLIPGQIFTDGNMDLA